MELIQYFTDPVLRAPMIGSMLMSTAASLVGVIVLLRRQSLIGEALSHAAYPGVVLGVVVMGIFYGDLTGSDFINVVMLIGAFITACLGVWLLRWMEEKLRVYPDAALCFVLSFFFGLGILIASYIQFPFSNLYRQIQTYFYGQAATLTDFHIVTYGSLVALIAFFLILFRKEFKVWIFDPQFAQVVGLNLSSLEIVFILLVALSVVIGIRSVGVVLMSAMLIAPAAAARQCAKNLKEMFFWAIVFGAFSAGLGTYIANEVSWQLLKKYPETRMILPTGPMIVLVASSICLAALFLAPERGILARGLRQIRFRAASLQENLLKTLFRIGPSPLFSLKEHLLVNKWHLRYALSKMIRQGWVKKDQTLYTLTKDGTFKAKHIVRLHRLWELYLADYVGVGPERVHASAEEMEHILTPELEKELTKILNDPKQDPHHQPIPPPQ